MATTSWGKGAEAVINWLCNQFNFDVDDMSGKIKGFLIDILSGFGINLQDLSGDQQELWKMKQSLYQLLSSVQSGYQTYTAEVFEAEPISDTKALEDALNQLTNEQSDFSRFLSGYAPFSTAKKMAQMRFRKLSQAAERASEALTAAQAANTQIENNNERGRTAVEKLNSAKAAAVDKANAEVDKRVSNINSLINQVGALENMSALAKATDTYKQIRSDVAADVEKVINSGTNTNATKTSPAEPQPRALNSKYSPGRVVTTPGTKQIIRR